MKIIIKKIFGLIGFEIKRIPSISKHIAFLHIGKTAGTQIMHVANQLNDYGVNIKKYHHFIKLADIPSNTKFFFSIRNPATRFVSGFYSRKKKNDHTLHEKKAFENFNHANDVAENLFSENVIGEHAHQAIKSISHNSMHQIDWFQGKFNFELQPPITIIRQEHFKEDMQRFLNLLNVDLEISNLTTEDKIIAHKNDYDNVPHLSEKALTNLKRWYVQDYEFYRMCERWLKIKNHIN
tara:strand:- start:1318 stop:2028 length:711 start_codon:yes stop_codon:yes gene_type:complete